MRSLRSQCLAATAVALFAVTSPAVAQDTETQQPPPQQPNASVDAEDLTPTRTLNFIDFTAGLGYSSNPFLRVVDAEGSFFGRLSARGVHTWRGEHSSTSISGFVEGSTYFNNYGLESLFTLDANHTQQVSEKVSIFGSAGVSGDLSGQLSNRFLNATPPGPDPTVPLPPGGVTDPNLFSFTGRQYRVYGQGGASIRTSERGSLTISAGAQRYMYTADVLNDYTTVFGTVAYDHSLSERTTVGFRLSGEHTEYQNSSDSSSIVSPALTLNTRLSEEWTASGSVGVSFTKVDRGGNNETSTDLALSGSLCRQTLDDRLCANVQRFSQTSSLASILTTDTIGLDWYKKIDEKSSLQLSAGYSHYEDKQTDELLKTDYFRAGASYDRRINPRFSVGAEVSARAYNQPGPNPDNDYSGSLFLRYRLGDLG